MMVRLHKNATTTPATRRYIQSSNLPVRRLARELGVSEDTIRRWKKRTDVEDRPHTAHRLQTNLTPFQEAVVVELRRTLMLPLDDLLAVVREFITPNVSRSGLDRCLRRHGLGSLKAMQPKAEKPGHKPFTSPTSRGSCIWSGRPPAHGVRARPRCVRRSAARADARSLGRALSGI